MFFLLKIFFPRAHVFCCRVQLLCYVGCTVQALLHVYSYGDCTLMNLDMHTVQKGAVIFTLKNSFWHVWMWNGIQRLKYKIHLPSFQPLHCGFVFFCQNSTKSPFNFNQSDPYMVTPVGIRVSIPIHYPKNEWRNCRFKNHCTLLDSMSGAAIF